MSHTLNLIKLHAIFCLYCTTDRDLCCNGRAFAFIFQDDNLSRLLVLFGKDYVVLEIQVGMPLGCS